MEYKHEPVLIKECLELLAPVRGGVFVDGTLGGAGHSLAVIQQLQPKRLIGIDRDTTAIEAASKRLAEYNGMITIEHDNYSNIDRVLTKTGADKIDGCLLDLGVSSYQLDTAERGFSYNLEAPLDMRMDTTQYLSAYHVVNEYSEWEIYRVIKDYGEENWAGRIAAFIVKARERGAVETTGQLVNIIKNAIPASARRTGPHPAKRTFQAIRIEVNSELAHLDKALSEVVNALKPGGRLCVITFQSLEDRIVKRAFKNMEKPCTCPPKAPICTCNAKPTVRILTHKPITAQEDELKNNPRSESAKLRAVEKI